MRNEWVGLLIAVALGSLALGCGSGTGGAAAYSIGGTVSQLAAAGLVLHSSIGSDEDLAVPPGATKFTFSQKAAPGTPYEVTVGTSPAGVSCTVAGGSGIIGNSNVTDIAVTCASLAITQRWTAPATWGALWPDDDPNLVHHASFNASGIQETKGIPWSWAGPAGTELAPRAFTGFPSGTRYGGGPFGAGGDPTRRYQAASDPLGADGDFIVCAVVEPGYDPFYNGQERAIVAKGWTTDQPLSPNPGGGWVLMQMHEQFCFHYEYTAATCPTGSCMGMAFTPTGFANGGAPDSGTLNPSYVVVCAGRDRDRIRIAANSFPDTNYADSGSAPFLWPGAHLDVGAVPATIGGYANGDPNHAFQGRIYETAVWRQAATPQNLQAKLAAPQGLLLPEGGVATYSRNREGPYLGADGRYHTTWRHGPRLDVTRGLLFGLQGWNRLSTWTCGDSACSFGDVTANGEALDRWTRSAGATVQRDQLQPPGDGEAPTADRVSLAAGASIAIGMASFEAAGPIHAQLWIRPAVSAGVLRAEVTGALGGGTAHADVNFAAVDAQGNPRYPVNAWTRVWLTGLTTDGTSTPGTFTLKNAGSTPLDFHAWGVDLTQIGGGGDLGPFDPGAAMYDWSAANDALNSGAAKYPQDVLQLPTIPRSTAATGFCLSAAASVPAGLAWDAPFGSARTAVAWVSDPPAASSLARLFVDGTTGSNPRQLCFRVDTGGAPALVCGAIPGAWTPGSAHLVTGCVSPAGSMRLYADGAQVGAAVADVSAPDLAGGHLLVGNAVAGAVPETTPWQGYVSGVVVCADTQTPLSCR